MIVTALIVSGQPRAISRHEIFAVVKFMSEIGGGLGEVRKR
jgi:hypothetical protein